MIKTLALALAIQLAAGAPLQDPAARILEKAILIEETEQDLPAAARLYRSVLEDPRASVQERTRARLRLAGCLRKLGREGEAVALLEEAAGGEGEAAERARKILEGTAGREDRLRARVEALIAAKPELGSPAYRQLVMIGEDAVPILVEAIEKGGGQVAFHDTSRILRPLLEIGGPEAAAFVRRTARSGDVLLKQILVDAYAALAGAPHGAGIDRAFFDLLRDDNPAVRRAALRATRSRLPEDLLASMAGDPSPSVRAEALDAALKRDLTTRADFMEAIEPFVVRAWGDEDRDVRARGLAFPAHPGILRTPAGRRIFLQGLTLEEIPASMGEEEWPLSLLQKGVVTVVSGTRVERRVADTRPFDSPPPPAPEEVLAAARKLGPVREAAEGSNPRRTALQIFIDKCLPGWGREAIPGVLGLVALGYGGGGISSWLAERELPAEAFEPIRGWIDRVLRENPQPARRTRSAGDLRTILGILGKLPSKRVVPYLVELVRRHGELLSSDVATIIIERNGEEAGGVLGEVVRAPKCSPAARRSILQHLASEGDPALVKLAPEAYELGVGGFMFLSWLLRRDAAHRLGEREVVAIFDGCLGLGNAEVWSEMDLLLRSKLDSLPRGAIASACRHAADLLGDASRSERIKRVLWAGSGSMPEAVELASRLLRSGDPGLLLQAGNWLLENAKGEARASGIEALHRLLAGGNEAVRKDAARVLAGHKVPQAAEWLRPLLKDESSSVRESIVRVLYGSFPGAPIDPLIELLGDPVASVRVAAASLLGNRLDRAAVPALIEALRDPFQGVRTAAGEALDAIQRYYDRVERWQGWLRGSELDADSAAEALLSQAEPENPREVRIAAIRSLGTLGVAETLPILIRMMTDEDPEIAKAARRAVERINHAAGEE